MLVKGCHINTIFVSDDSTEECSLKVQPGQKVHSFLGDDLGNGKAQILKPC